MKILRKISLASSAILVLGITVFSSKVVATDAVFTVRANAVIELTVPSIVNLNLHPTTNADFNTASMNISVGTNNPTGYTLTMTADSDTLTHIGSVIDSGSGNPYTPTILPILTTGSATGYTAAQFESSTTDAYTLNRWGYKLSTARANWKELSNKYDMFVNKTCLFQLKSRLRNWLKLRDMAEKLRNRLTVVGMEQLKEGVEFKKILVLMRTLFDNWDERNKFLAKRFFIRKWFMQVKRLNQRGTSKKT